MIQPDKGRNVVWLASYPRSGNTWLRFFLHNLIEIQAGRPGGDINDINKYSTWEAGRDHFEAVIGKDFDPKDYAAIFNARSRAQSHISHQNRTGLVLLKTHLGIMSTATTASINSGISAGAVYVVRNPLDVVPSLSTHLELSIDGAIDLMADPRGHLYAPDKSDRAIVFEPMGTWSDHVAGWTGSTSQTLLTVRYEDMLADPASTFGAIARHLRFGSSAGDIERAIELSSFGRARSQEEEAGYRVERGAGAPPFFRSGRAGGYEAVLTEDQIARVVALHGETMERFSYLPEQMAARQASKVSDLSLKD